MDFNDISSTVYTSLMKGSCRARESGVWMEDTGAQERKSSFIVEQSP